MSAPDAKKAVACEGSETVDEMPRALEGAGVQFLEAGSVAAGPGVAIKSG